MSTFSTTQINGKQCTAVPRNNIAGQKSVVGSSTSISTTFISSSTSSTSTSFSTSFSTSTSVSSATATVPVIANPADTNTGQSTVVTSTEQTSTTSTSSTSSQSVTSSTSSPNGDIQSQSSTAIVVGTSQAETSLSSTTTPSITPNDPSSPVPAIATSSAQTNAQDPSAPAQTNASLAPSGESDSAPSSTILSTDNPDTGPTSSLASLLTSTIPSDAVESGSGGAGQTNGAQTVTGNAMGTQTTVAVAGGVIGGLAAVSIIGFLFWFWRKRTMKKRRSTLLTPLSSDNANERGEKGPYVISRNSLGPTTIPEKLRAVVGYNYQRIRGRVNSLVTRSPKPSVDLNRGNSQYGMPNTPASRSSSRAGSTRIGSTTTTKQRFVDWWGRLTEDSNLNWKLSRGEPGGGQSGGNFTALSNTRASRPGSQSNFLPRRSQSLGNEHFLGGLGLDFENPFADSKAMSHDSAKVMPLTVSGANNPFSDNNAIPQSQPGAAGPATYVQNIRRSRGHSVASTSATLRPPSTAPASRMPSTYRVSAMTMDSVDPRLNRIKSDPFDLDRPEFIQSPGSSVGGVAGRSDGKNSGLPSMPRRSHTRAESFTSRYSSGVSLGEWSDPGPDVGPAGSRWNTPSPNGALGRVPSNGSEKKGKPGGGVGTAM
ncbi:hypothetical protein GGR57DRAFT_472017 [Xylariaceae sp. FL1272]|nr:hypothetical protein GGR57DRAFT_472017 [Xylariaceae sp. FL1272]